jgi:acyl carrier protein
MASEQDIATQIRTALAQHLKRDVGKIRPEDRLREDLGLDSLAMIELLFKIEEHFDLEIPNEDLSRITTVADVTAYVEEKLGPRHVAAAPAVQAPPLAAAAPPASIATTVPGQTAPARSAEVGKRAAPPATAKPRPAPARPPANVTSIKAAAKRRAGGAAAKPAAPKKKGSRRG